MTTIKSFTSLEQSYKLAEILPLESADMWWLYVSSQGKHIAMMYEEPDPHYLARMESYGIKDAAIRCWSLAALYGILPNNRKETTTLSRGGWKIEPVEYIDKWFCEYEDEVDEDSPCKAITVSADNPIDACYEMILKLHELKKL